VFDILTLNIFVFLVFRKISNVVTVLYICYGKSKSMMHYLIISNIGRDSSMKDMCWPCRSSDDDSCESISDEYYNIDKLIIIIIDKCKISLKNGKDYCVLTLRHFIAGQ
jgi:hypothetical protein